MILVRDADEACRLADLIAPEHEADPPLELGIDDRALDQHAVAVSINEPFEAALAIGVAEQPKVCAIGRCSRT